MVNTRLATILGIGVSTGIWGELEIIVASKPAALDKPRSASVPIGLRVRFQPPSRSELSRRRQSQRSRDQSVRNGPARGAGWARSSLGPADPTVQDRDRKNHQKRDHRAEQRTGTTITHEVQVGRLLIERSYGQPPRVI